ncbi:MAG TPA: PEPxxWA-CTERM sorting domain-containing protein [Sphingomonas sp.]|nr:PEPxxWA-CTERM sorting domain-containing protein [Sphingomonas sp.]
MTAKTGGVGDELNQGGAGNGFAIVSGTPRFDEITIDPQNFDGFSKLQFFLAYQAKTPNPTSPPPQLNIDYGTFLLSYTLVGGGSGSTLVSIQNGNQRFQLFGDAGEVFSSVTLSKLKGSAHDGPGSPFVVNAAFDNIRQISFEAAASVPEPASWALMLGGFGVLGVAARRRRRTVVTFA